VKKGRQPERLESTTETIPVYLICRDGSTVDLFDFRPCRHHEYLDVNGQTEWVQPIYTGVGPVGSLDPLGCDIPTAYRIPCGVVYQLTDETRVVEGVTRRVMRFHGLIACRPNPKAPKWIAWMQERAEYLRRQQSPSPLDRLSGNRLSTPRSGETTSRRDPADPLANIVRRRQPDNRET
jgi:hypothetical protein